MLANLRESSSIEQDADDPAEHQKWKEKMDRIHGLSDVLVEKHRHGVTAKVTLRFEKQYTRFYDMAREDHLPAQTH